MTSEKCNRRPVADRGGTWRFPSRSFLLPFPVRCAHCTAVTMMQCGNLTPAIAESATVTVTWRNGPRRWPTKGQRTASLVVVGSRRRARATAKAMGGARRRDVRRAELVPHGIAAAHGCRARRRWRLGLGRGRDGAIIQRATPAPGAARARARRCAALRVSRGQLARQALVVVTHIPYDGYSSSLREDLLMWHVIATQAS